VAFWDSAPWRCAAKTGGLTKFFAQLKVRMNRSRVDGAMVTAFVEVFGDFIPRSIRSNVGNPLGSDTARPLPRMAGMFDSRTAGQGRERLDEKQPGGDKGARKVN
jgi:hypothetical protein